MAKKQSRLKWIIDTTKSTLVLFLVTVCTISALIYLVYQINKVDSLKREIDKQKRVIADYKIRNDRLKKQIDHLEEYPRIEKIVREKLHLIPAKSAPVKFRVEKEEYTSKTEQITKKRDVAE
mgnify:CR=1 FL=1